MTFKYGWKEPRPEHDWEGDFFGGWRLVVEERRRAFLRSYRSRRDLTDSQPSFLMIL